VCVCVCAHICMLTDKVSLVLGTAGLERDVPVQLSVQTCRGRSRKAALAMASTNSFRITCGANS
jgi:hypothetical protein